MGGRYIVTGAQLGMLMAFVEEEKFLESVKLLNKIFANNHLGDKDFLADLNDADIGKRVRKFLK